MRAVLMSRPSWLLDGQAQVLRRAMTHTDSSGLWRLDLLPYTHFESQLQCMAFYKVIEDTHPPAATYIRVPETDPPAEFWLRDLMIDIPDCTSTKSSSFIPINTLSRLWDVDRESVARAKPGDFLVLLPNGKWGASRGPMPLTLYWEPDHDDMMTVSVVVGGFGGAGARLGFGDNTDEVVVHTTEPVKHTYATPGTYVLTATDVAWPAFFTTTRIGVKDHKPRINVFVDGDDDWRALLWVKEDADDTRYAIDWGDNSPIEETHGHSWSRVPPRPRVPHQYREIGTYTVVVTDLATKRQSQSVVEIGEIGVLITYDEPDRPRIDALWMANGARWEMARDGFPPATGIVPPSCRVTHLGPHVDPGDYRFEVREIVTGTLRRTAVRRRVQPTQWDWRMDVVMTWRAHDDPLGTQTVTVTARGARNRCTVEWGDGSAAQVVDPGVAISHRYTLPVPEQGLRLRLTETGIEDPRTWTRVLGAPRHVGVPTLNARSNGAVDLDIAGLDQPYNDDWYSVAWGDGSDPDPVGAAGRWFPAHHYFARQGTYEILVDGPGMPEPIRRETEVVFYPSPSILAGEALDLEGRVIDPNRRTTRIAVNNTASGGPCTVLLGDGSTPRKCAEIETFTHVYGKPGDPRQTFHIVASSDADPTAKGRAAVTIPFDAPRTLFFDITGVDEGQPEIYKIKVKITGKTPGQVVQVRWEEGGGFENVPPSNELTHQYPPAEDNYDLMVRYQDDSETWTNPIDLPWGGPVA